MNGKVYKIHDNTNGNDYYGSTTQQYLSNRLAGHRKAYKKYLEGKKPYTSSCDIIANEDYTISLVEDVACDNREQLFRRERYYIENFNCVNRAVPLRTDAEYYRDHAEHYKQYRAENESKLKEYISNYRIENADKLKIKNKAYYEKHKEAIQKKRAEIRRLAKAV